MNIPLPKGLKGLRSSPRAQESLHNLIYSADDVEYLTIRPTVNGLGELNGACRGMGLFRNQVTGEEEVYGVYGTKLYRLEIVNPVANRQLTAGDVTATEIGDIPEQAEVIILSDFAVMLVMVKAGNAYTYDGTTLTQITDPEFKPSVSVALDAGRFVYCPADGSPIFWSSVGKPWEIDGADFIDGEFKPDPNKAVYQRKGLIYVLGSRSIEVFQYNLSQASYTRIAADSTNTGYVSCLVPYGDSFAFLGQNEQGGFDFFAMSDVPVKISTPSISEQVNTTYETSDLVNASAFYIVWKGSPLLIFNIAGDTYCFAGDWSFLHSGISKDSKQTWRINHTQYAYGYVWTGDSLDGSFGVLTESGSDYGNPIEYELNTFIMNEGKFRVGNVYLNCTSGRDADARMALSVSLDGVIFGTDVWRDIGTSGDYARRTKWGVKYNFSGYCGLKIRGYGTEDFSITGLTYD